MLPKGFANFCRIVQDAAEDKLLESLQNSG